LPLAPREVAIDAQSEEREDFKTKGQPFKRLMSSKPLGYATLMLSLIAATIGVACIVLIPLRANSGKEVLVAIVCGIAFLGLTVILVHQSLDIIFRENFDFRPGAFGLPNRGDVSFACRTRSSNSAFVTFRTFRTALLNFRNSGDASNCSAVMGGRSSSSPAPAALVRRSAMLFRSLLPSEFLVGQPASDDMAHHIDEALNVVHVPVIVAKCLLINVPEEVKWFDRDVGSP